MKIGLTIRTFYPKSGGLQAHAEKLIHELHKRGHEVTIITRSISHTPSYRDYFFFSESVSQANINGLSVFVLTHPKIFNFLMWVISKFIERKITQRIGIYLFQWLFTKKMAEVLKDVEIIHHVGQAHELIGFAAAEAANFLKVPFLVQPTLHPGQWGDSQLDIFLYQKAKRLLVHSEFEQNSFIKLGLQKPFDIVGNGIENRLDGNAKRFRTNNKIEEPIILFLGRKESDKGYPLVKQAFQIVKLKIKNVTLVCIGPSPTKQTASKSINEEGMIELDFCSEQDKHDALAACTVLCVPSEGESFGLVYMEAGLYAKPSIARRLPVLEELLGNHQASFLVGNSYGEGNQVQVKPEELSEAIIQLISNNDLAQKIGVNAYKVSNQFLWSKVVSRFEISYQQAISSA